jgi:hypothetical protein
MQTVHAVGAQFLQSPVGSAAQHRRAPQTGTPTLYQNWLTPEDVRNLLYLAGFEPVRSWNEMLFPLPVPLLDPFFNRFLCDWRRLTNWR